jgi:hypothetical protein
MPVIAVPIAIGAYELLVAGAATAGLGVVAVAKRRELAEGLGGAASIAGEAAMDVTAKALPWIAAPLINRVPRIWRDDADTAPFPIPEAAGLDLLDALQPWAPPILHSESAQPKNPPLPIPLEDAGADGGAGAPPPGQGPRWRDLIKAARDGAAQIIKHPAIQGAATCYKWYIYGSTVLSVAEISRRMIAGDEANGPILYDYVYQPIFGESVAARALLGGHQVMAAETTSGMLAIALAKHLVGKRFAGTLGEKFVEKFLAQLPGFKTTHAYTLMGNITFFEDQMAANAMSTEHVDIDRATRTAAFFGFTSIAYYPLVGILSNVDRIKIGKWVLDGIGRVGFEEWLAKYTSKQLNLLRPNILDYGNHALAAMWQGAARILGPQLAARVAPHYAPRFQTWVLYAGFATVYRNVTTALASLPWLEDSNWSESMKMANVRNALSIALTDPYFYLGAKVNSWRSIFGNQLVFMGFIYALNQFYSRFDGKDIAVNEADRTLHHAASQSGAAVRNTVLSKPFTQRNFIVPPYLDLSVSTWAQLSKRYAGKHHLTAGHVEALVSATQVLLKSNNQDERRAGRALGVLLTQVSFNPQWKPLKATLRNVGVILDPDHAHHALSESELNQVFTDINDGKYDRRPLFQFPLS